MLKFSGIYVVDTKDLANSDQTPRQIVTSYLRQETNAVSSASYLKNSPEDGRSMFYASGGWILPEKYNRHVTSDTDKIVFLKDDDEHPDATEFGVKRHGKEDEQIAFLEENKGRVQEGTVQREKPRRIFLSFIPKNLRAMPSPVYSLKLQG